MQSYLQEIEMEILPQDECRTYEGTYDEYVDELGGCVKRNYSLRNDELIVEHILCAKNPELGRSTCTGDSGGPLTVKQGDRHILVGVTANGYGCGLVSFLLASRIPIPRYIPACTAEYHTTENKLSWKCHTRNKS